MFRFTIRDVLWLTVVVAMGVGWWVDRVQLRNRITSDEASKYEAISKARHWKSEAERLDQSIEIKLRKVYAELAAERDRRLIADEKSAATSSTDNRP